MDREDSPGAMLRHKIDELLRVDQKENTFELNQPSEETQNELKRVLENISKQPETVASEPNPLDHLFEKSTLNLRQDAPKGKYLDSDF